MSFVVWILVALCVAAPAWAQQHHHSRHALASAQQPTQSPAPGPAASAAPAAPSPSLPITGERPFVAIRVDCDEGPQSPLCIAVMEAATEAAARSYRVVDQAKVETYLNKEPALRACRRQDCRVVITDALGAAKLLDLAIATQGRRMAGSVSIYDAVVKDISGDTEVPPTHRDEREIRKAIAAAVDYVIGTQRLTALLRLSIKPEGARVKIDDADRGTVREVRLFLGSHKVTVEKMGFITDSRTVNVSPAGAQLEVHLQQQPLPVRFQWAPFGARATVDGDPLDQNHPVMELKEGKHRLQILPEVGSQYDAKECEFEVHPAMRQPVSCNAPLMAQIRITQPVGYTARVDNAQVDQAAAEHGRVQELVLPVSAGQHMVTSVSYRGREHSLVAQTFAGRQTELAIRAPTLVPGLVLAGLGLVGIGLGAWMVAIDGSCAQPDCRNVWDTATGGGVLLGLSGAALAGGAFWFIYNAVDNPLFYGRSPGKKTAAQAGLAVLPVVRGDGGALLVGGRF